MNHLPVIFGLIVILATAFGTPNGCRRPIFTINGVKYSREVLKVINSPETLSYDPSTNSIYMIYQSSNPTLRVVAAKLNLNNNEFENLNIDKNVATAIVDPKTHKVYIQTRDGIYKYDKERNVNEFYVANDESVAKYTRVIFAKDDIVYFTTIPMGTVYKIVDGKSSKFIEKSTISTLVIDDHDNVFFTNSSGLYRQKVGSNDAVYYEGTAGNPFKGFAINKAGEVFTSTGTSGIYAVKNTNEVEQVLDDTVRGLVFDNDGNIIYADDGKLYKLKPCNV